MCQITSKFIIYFILPYICHFYHLKRVKAKIYFHGETFITPLNNCLHSEGLICVKVV